LKIGLLRIGEIESSVLNHLEENIPKFFTNAKCEIIPAIMPIPNSSFNPSRKQYHSSIILVEMKKFAENLAYNRILGIANVDLYVPHLNFVFGEAEFPGKLALISVFRLRPEFYGQPSNMKLFLDRTLKEAVHELGHTFGLKHCKNPSCVMFFSNSIIDTDKKNYFFCEICSQKLGLNQLE